jgi:hypothetical protein
MKKPVTGKIFGDIAIDYLLNLFKFQNKIQLNSLYSVLTTYLLS